MKYLTQIFFAILAIEGGLVCMFFFVWINVEILKLLGVV